jgi:PIN domain
VDVIVDTNILAADFQMTGARLSSLFDYLKRTDGEFVVLNAVKTELLAVYRRQLSERLNKAESTWNALNQITANSKAFPKRDIDSEVNLMEKRLMENSNGARTSLFSAPIDVLEVVRRGAQRIPPASDNGEELRDVIIWLSVLEYSRATNRDAAFICNDKGFWNGETLREQIEEDLAPLASRPKVYRDLDGFIGDNNLRSSSIDHAHLSKYVDDTHLTSLLREGLKSRLAVKYPQSTFEVFVDQIEYVSGTTYEVSSAASFVEFEFRFAASLQTSEPQGYNYDSSWASVDSSHGAVQYVNFYPFSQLPNLFDAYNRPLQGSLLPSSVPESQTAYALGLTPGASSVTTAYAPNAFVYVTAPPPSSVAGEATFTMRVLDKKRQRIDLDGLALRGS